jgi:ABC-type lipoprotein release transport system permease subunit
MNGTNIPAIAWRNLWRNRRRTLLTLFSIVFGVFLAIMFTALQDRNWSDMIDLAARLGGGHVSIAHLDYSEIPSLKKTIQDASVLAAIARKQQYVTKVTGRISGSVMLNTAGESYGATFIALDPTVEDKHTLSLLDPDALMEGTMFTTANDKGIILGYKLAENLGVSLGNKIVYTMTDKQGEIISGLARLSGTIKTGAPNLDAGLSLLPLATIQEFVGYAPGEITKLAVFIEDQRKSSEVAERLDDAINMEVAVLPWYRSQPELAAFIALKVGGTRFMSAFIGLLVAAGIFNTLFVSVMERLREFGILMAIGFTPLRLFSLVMMESFWLALLGLVGAAAVTIGPYLYLSSVGIDIGKILDAQGTLDIAGVAMSTTLKVGIFPESVLMICIAAVVATLLAGLYPAWRAGNVAPVEAIKLV